MDFALSDTERAIRDTARDFITREVMPLEQELLRRERAHRPGLEHSELRELQLKARKFGFWGLATPEEYGGMDLPAVTAVADLDRTRPLVRAVPVRRRGGQHPVPRQ